MGKKITLLKKKSNSTAGWKRGVTGKHVIIVFLFFFNTDTGDS